MILIFIIIGLACVGGGLFIVMGGNHTQEKLEQVDHGGAFKETVCVMQSGSSLTSKSIRIEEVHGPHNSERTEYFDVCEDTVSYSFIVEDDGIDWFISGQSGKPVGQRALAERTFKVERSFHRPDTKQEAEGSLFGDAAVKDVCSGAKPYSKSWVCPGFCEDGAKVPCWYPAEDCGPGKEACDTLHYWAGCHNPDCVKLEHPSVAYAEAVSAAEGKGFGGTFLLIFGVVWLFCVLCMYRRMSKDREECSDGAGPKPVCTVSGETCKGDMKPACVVQP